MEENQKLATECANLLDQCNKWEKECSLYDHDREALMDFGNEADNRAKEAEACARDLEQELVKLSKELLFYKHQSEGKQVFCHDCNRQLTVACLPCFVHKFLIFCLLFS